MAAAADEEEAANGYGGGGGGGGSGGFLLFRSKSLPHVAAPAAAKLNMLEQQSEGDDSGVLCGGASGTSSAAACIEAAVAADRKSDVGGRGGRGGGGGVGGGVLQGDFASGGSMLPSGEEMEMMDDAAAVKQLVLGQIDKKLRDLRTLKQHYYPEGGWGWVVLAVGAVAQALAAGAQIALAMHLIKLAGAAHPPHPPSTLDHSSAAAVVRLRPLGGLARRIAAAQNAPSE